MLDDFWAKVEKTDGCWLWTGRLNHGGYGNFSMPRGQSNAVHRTVSHPRAASAPSAKEASVDSHDRTTQVDTQRLQTVALGQTPRDAKASSSDRTRVARGTFEGRSAPQRTYSSRSLGPLLPGLARGRVAAQSGVSAEVQLPSGDRYVVVVQWIGDREAGAADV